MGNIHYFCSRSEIEDNAATQLLRYADQAYIQQICAFTDIHYCDEKALPVGVAFSSQQVFYPLITGKDIGCGVMYLKIPKSHWCKPFDKQAHYKALVLAHTKMTDDGLGGGNHFLSVEEDEQNIFVLCHTGTRDRGIALYQHCLAKVEQFSLDLGEKCSYLPWEFLTEEFLRYYQQVLNYGYQRRKNFCLKTLMFLQKAGYVKANKWAIEEQYLGKNLADWPEQGDCHGTPYELGDSMHNQLSFCMESKTAIHRKGSTALKEGETVVIPLSMTRGSLLVRVKDLHLAKEALFSCAHGAGRKLSRYACLKHWKTGVKEKERRQYKERFSEMLDRSGDFPTGYVQEFDFAYKDASELFVYQNYLKKMHSTRPIVTVKYTEI